MYNADSPNGESPSAEALVLSTLARLMEKIESLEARIQKLEGRTDRSENSMSLLV